MTEDDLKSRLDKLETHCLHIEHVLHRLFYYQVIKGKSEWAIPYGDAELWKICTTGLEKYDH